LQAPKVLVLRLFKRCYR